jgi:predicted amidohydrolase YtcJ
MAAHSQGGGAVDTLLDQERTIAPTRSHLIHASWMSPESIALCKKLGVGAVRYFIPLRSLADAGVIFAGGSDHMAGWDKNTAVNAFNPFLGMYAAITRKTIKAM